MAEAERNEEAGSALHYTLPSRDYTAPEVFEAEKTRIFHRTWQFAGHLEALREPGDYVTCAVAGQDLFVIRDRDGELRGFYNVCQHRAHQLVTGAGRVKRIVCPYHAWTYGLDGRLAGAPNTDKVPGFDASDICLAEVRVETFCHLVFVNLDPDATPLRELTEGLEDEIRALAPRIDDVVLADRVEKDLAANWKVVVENYSECYHCALTHPTFTRGVVDASSYRIVPHGLYQRHISDGQPAERASYDFDRRAGGETFAAWYIWPAAAVQVYPGGAVNTFRWRPLSPGRTRVVHDWFFPETPASEDHMALVRQHRETTFAEDVPLVESVQRGLASHGYDRGPLMIDTEGSEKSELPLKALHDLWRQAMGEPEASPG
jgi:phenylpropionate dioxygenase-like ring-hydroxylating dioxygenase large terminal subunit